MDDIEVILSQIMTDEFNVTLEDDSPYLVAKHLFLLYSQCVSGKFEELERLRERSKIQNSFTASSCVKGGDDSEDDDDDEEEEVNTNVSCFDFLYLITNFDTCFVCRIKNPRIKMRIWKKKKLLWMLMVGRSYVASKRREKIDRV